MATLVGMEGKMVENMTRMVMCKWLCLVVCVGIEMLVVLVAQMPCTRLEPATTVARLGICHMIVAKSSSKTYLMVIFVAILMVILVDVWCSVFSWQSTKYGIVAFWTYLSIALRCSIGIVNPDEYCT